MSYTQLTQAERYHISQGLKRGDEIQTIADSLGRHRTSISREIARNTGKKGYRHKQAQRVASNRATTKVKPTKLTADLIATISNLIQQDYSPEQVVGKLMRKSNISIHHETVYRLILKDKEEGGTLYTHLRIVTKKYRRRYGTKQRRGSKIINRTSISQRPAIVEERSRIGDWEGDTIIGKDRKSAMLTLVERKTRLVKIIKIKGKNATILADKMIEAMTPLSSIIHTITFDNGLEFAAHECIAKALNADIFFAHPYSSWERGANENMNGLIRQYFPKGMDLNEVSDERVKEVEDKLNNRPRKVLDYQSPNEVLWAEVAV